MTNAEKTRLQLEFKDMVRDTNRKLRTVLLQNPVHGGVLGSLRKSLRKQAAAK